MVFADVDGENKVVGIVAVEVQLDPPDDSTIQIAVDNGAPMPAAALMVIVLFALMPVTFKILL